ncbi:hypothetical protein B0H67DRAFT_567210 [Lasiosphaeris hirsuta]|uniref:Uncharacterized protein n=1 Tax=Lasiosphaeris hirsuta TaxID=260670 RepID=A0AA40E151_9PEZI|nr:hypothetical protein B0H67DRAFT_567210 [Lasiosphaeris hirsuta]
MIAKQVPLMINIRRISPSQRFGLSQLITSQPIPPKPNMNVQTRSMTRSQREAPAPEPTGPLSRAVNLADPITEEDHARVRSTLRASALGRILRRHFSD